MNCKEVIEKLPKYLDGECSEEERKAITSHISTCNQCMNQMIDMEEPIFVKQSELKQDIERSGKAISKARRRLVNNIALRVLSVIVIIFSLVFLVIPGLMMAARSSQMTNYSRALSDLVQFTETRTVGGYGNSFKGHKIYSTELSIFSSQMVGNKIKEEDSEKSAIKADLNLVTGKIENPEYSISQFIHPDITPTNEVIDEFNPKISSKILTKNGDNTVAKVNISLYKTIQLKDVINLLKKYDVKVLWMAVECGEEKIKPANISSGLNQYIQWGIPGTLFQLDSKIHNIELTKDNENEYNDKVMEELKWLDKNKNLIKPDKELLKNQNIDNSVGNKVKYIINNGINIYGLQITGPTKELLRLQGDLNIRFEKVTDIDFWYWK